MKKITFALFMSASITLMAQPFAATYTFDSVKTTSGTTDPSLVPTAAGLTFGSFMAVATSANSNAAGRFDFNNWPGGSTGGTGDTLYAGMTGVINTLEYYEVTLSPSAGYTLNLDTIKFAFERSGTGVRSYAVRSSMDAYVSNLTAVYLPPPTTNVIVEPGNDFFLRRDIVTAQNRNAIILGGISFTNIAIPVTFRFYAWNAEPGTAGTFSIDNVRFSGSAATATGIIEKTITAISIYPNPSNDGVFMVDAGTATIIAYNILGKKIFEKTLSGKEQIDLSAEVNGSYFLHIQNADGVVTKKVTINK
jgi:hypothetical protein